ncbi:MAG: hypothetical protein GF364_18180 [Candidatus Lokiarchaeota archaeon]|nr:hypothetical protein [Candidatus Lokiarchaeota archaeon]
MKIKKTFWNLLILFEIVLIIKICISFFMEMPIIYSDESCVVLRAKHFIETFNIETCNELSKLKGKDPLPIYSILISPIYLFFSGFKAYYAILILNSLLISSTVFPLYSIFKKYINDNKYILISILLCVFIPEIVAYEKTLMTETLFMSSSIWLLFFYVKSLENNAHSSIYKILSIILSLIITFTRPFGFISFLAIIISEILISKNRVKIGLVLFPLTLFITAFAAYFYMGSSGTSYLTTKLNSLYDIQNWIFILKAIHYQFNSLLIATYFIPVIIFLTNIKKLKKEKFFLISFIILNLIISAQHIYGYYLNEKDPLLITRYINVSTSFIIFYALILLKKQKKFLASNYSFLIIIISLGALLLFKDGPIKHSLNFSIISFYDPVTHYFNLDLIESKHILGIPFLLFSFMLIFLYITNKKRLIALILGTILITQSTILYFNHINYTIVPHIVQAFSKEESNITYLTDNTKNIELDLVWQLITVTDNRITPIFISFSGDNPDQYSKLDTDDFKHEDFYKSADYIITTHKLDLPLELTDPKEHYKVYKKW